MTTQRTTCELCHGQRYVETLLLGPHRCPVCRGTGEVDADRDA